MILNTCLIKNRFRPFRAICLFRIDTGRCPVLFLLPFQGILDTEYSVSETPKNSRTKLTVNKTYSRTPESLQAMATSFGFGHFGIRISNIPTQLRINLNYITPHHENSICRRNRNGRQ